MKTLEELQAKAADWKHKPDRHWQPTPTMPAKDAVKSWNLHVAKNSLRLAVELSVNTGVPLQRIAEELVAEMDAMTARVIDEKCCHPRIIQGREEQGNRAEGAEGIDDEAEEG